MVGFQLAIKPEIIQHVDKHQYSIASSAQAWVVLTNLVAAASTL
jgi:hypothetical protein